MERGWIARRIAACVEVVELQPFGDIRGHVLSPWAIGQAQSAVSMHACSMRRRQHAQLICQRGGIRDASENRPYG